MQKARDFRYYPASTRTVLRHRLQQGDNEDPPWPTRGCRSSISSHIRVLGHTVANRPQICAVHETCVERETRFYQQ